MTIKCDWFLFDVCLVKASSSSDTIFGFSEFISGLALLVIVYTITDFRYKFRVSTSSIDLHKITFAAIPIIGVGTLATELWVAQSWPTFTWNISQALWQSILALTFLILISVWIWFAFIKPPVFNNRNYKKFSNVLYQALLRGNTSELDVISYEIGRSIANIIDMANSPDAKGDGLPKGHEIYFANDIILLLANKKFCDSIAINSPSTAIKYFEKLASLKSIYNNSFSLFAYNLSNSFLNNKNSQLYYESNKFSSDLLGHIKPLSNSLYGDYRLIKKLSNGLSPLDVDYSYFQHWDNSQLEKYCASVVLCFKSFLNNKYVGSNTSIFYRAIDLIKSTSMCIAHVDTKSTNIYQSEELERFKIVIDFAINMTEALNSCDHLNEEIKLRIRDYNEQSVCDYIAELYFEIIHSSAYIKEPVDTCWYIQHNITWYRLMGNFSVRSTAQKIISHKLRRKIYDAICEFSKYPNYMVARYLGFCINVLWIKSHLSPKNDNGYALRKAMIKWLRANYLKLRAEEAILADACLMDGIGFDEDKQAIYKTYRSRPGRPTPREYFYLIEKTQPVGSNSAAYSDNRE